MFICLTQGIIVLWGCYMAWKTKGVSMAFNESKEIAISIYNIFLMGSIIIPLKFGLELGPDADFLLQFCEFTLILCV